VSAPPPAIEGPGQASADLTPRQIVAELDRFVVGQARAKRAVAIALRNRVRRRRLPPAVAAEVTPKNILMIGPTGVGKTEIARRLARLSGSPFLKVEASKFTEVGYVGRDVESMVRDLVEIAIDQVGQERRIRVRIRAAESAERRLLDLLLPPRPATRPADPAGAARAREEQESWDRSREVIRRQLAAGDLEDRLVEVDVPVTPTMPVLRLGGGGVEDLDGSLREMLPGLFGARRERRKMSVAEAREVLCREDEDRMIDRDQVVREALRCVEESGILFIDEIDKIAGRERGHGPDVSREGVQRDLLPLVEGTIVSTKHGHVRTDHILFVAAGAFHVSKPSDLIPELQGRFPIRVELDSLDRDDLVRILQEPEGSLPRQYTALLGTEGIELVFETDGIAALADAAATLNQRTENIGARRLATVVEKVLEEVSFRGAEGAGSRVTIDAAYVNERLGDLAQAADLSRFIL
jgi:ATP-dependent HslUV protease ATP-binding subunit HslU